MPLRIGSREFTKEQTIFIAVCTAIVLALILVVLGVLPGGRNKAEAVDIDVWVVDEDTKVWKTTVSRFRNSYPNINVNITEIDPSGYEEELINALAAGYGPDVFMFHSKWLVEHGDKIIPAPSDKISADSLKGMFAQVVGEDFVADGRVYAMPMSVDTLALLYNRDILDKKGVVFPPKTWEEFDASVAKIRAFENGVITERAAAIGGTTKSVPNAIDILGLMMMQNGSLMVNESYTKASFGRGAEVALADYTKFADSLNPLYTWRDSFGDANEAFAKEQVAMTFGYPADVKEIQDINPFLDFEISEMPQVEISSSVNFANYWGFAVSNSSDNPEVAWDFVIFATTDSVSAEEYASQAAHAPALRFLIANYLDNPDLGIFAKQALTARSWPQPNDDTVNATFNDMISSVSVGGLKVGVAISRAESSLTELIRK